MARKFGGKYSPDGGGERVTGSGDTSSYRGATVEPAGARANLMFLPAVPMVFLALNDGATGLMTALVSAAALTGGQSSPDAASRPL